jgi:hypothetical protein
MRVTSRGDTWTRIREQQGEQRADARVFRREVGDLDADIEGVVS